MPARLSCFRRRYPDSPNHPEYLTNKALIDAAPKVTEMKAGGLGPYVQVVASTFDEPSGEHIHVSDIALKAKRMVEAAANVVILLDSITRPGVPTEVPFGRQVQRWPD